ncbi:MAG: hypothetical protein AAGA56_29310, partial [Myxococcota bacterium]
MRIRSLEVALGFAGLVTAAACQDPVELAGRGIDDGDPGDTTAQTGGSGPGFGSQPGEGGTTTTDTTGTTGAENCGGVVCDIDEVCVESGGEEMCEERDCADPDACGPTEECVPQAMDGAICEDISCMSDAECPLSRWCDTDDDLCVDDVCTPFAQRCSANDPLEVEECAPNGSGYTLFATCPGGATSSGASSECTVIDADTAGCNCVDDWDCPGSQTCEVGVCTGSSAPPTCLLEAADIQDVLPAQEIVWGGANGSNVTASTRLVNGVDVTTAPSPWASVSQVTQTPIVANLDDDNGDGLVD